MEMSVSESMKNMRTRREQQRVMWLIPVRVMEDVRPAAVENGVTTSQLVTRRDNYTCQVCGKTNGRFGCVSHITTQRRRESEIWEAESEIWSARKLLWYPILLVGNNSSQVSGSFVT